MARSARKISAEHISAAVFFTLSTKARVLIIAIFRFGGGKLLGEIRRVGC